MFVDTFIDEEGDYELEILWKSLHEFGLILNVIIVLKLERSFHILIYGHRKVVILLYFI